MRAADATVARRRTAVIAAWVAVAIVAALVVAMQLFARRMNRQACAENLHQVGLGILIYAQDHGGHFPDTLAELTASAELTPACLVCPASGDTAAAAPTTRAVSADLASGGHLSYAYFGRGLDAATLPADAVVCCEPLTNHGGAGMNVLFGDGHVGWVSRADAVPLFARLAAGERPLRYTPRP